MFSEQALRDQYGEKNVQVAQNFSQYSSYLAPAGFMITVKRKDFIKSPLPFNPDQLMSGIAIAEVPAHYEAKPREQWKLDKKSLFGDMDGSTAQLVSCHCQDSTGHQLTKKKFVVVRAGIPDKATASCAEIEEGLTTDPPKEYTWEQFFRTKNISQLRADAREKRADIIRQFLVGVGACSVQEADNVKVIDDITTHDIAVPKGDKENLLVCSDVVPPNSLTKGMIVFEGPMVGVRVFSGKPDGSLFGRGFMPSDTVIPASYGLETIERKTKTDFEQSAHTKLHSGQKKNIYHFRDTYKKPNQTLIADVRVNGRNLEWPETCLHAEAVYIA